MGFLVNKITGDGRAQTAITNDAILEAVVNSLVAYNTTDKELTFTVSINGSTIFSESVDANSTYRLPDKLNLGAVSTLEVHAPRGLDVTVSYLQQAIDVAGVLNAAQILAQQASDIVQQASYNSDSILIAAKSIVQQASNEAGSVLSGAQSIVQQASDEADRAAAIVGQLPVGTIDDLGTSANTVWSSQKVAEELASKPLASGKDSSIAMALVFCS